MHLRPVFTEKIVNVFGEKGRAWLEQFPQVLASCEQRWRLTNVRLAGELSYNLVCFAESPAYGAVVLKIGVLHSEVVDELKVLSVYAGRGICACYGVHARTGREQGRRGIAFAC